MAVEEGFREAIIAALAGWRSGHAPPELSTSKEVISAADAVVAGLDAWAARRAEADRDKQVIHGQHRLDGLTLQAMTFPPSDAIGRLAVDLAAQAWRMVEQGGIDLGSCWVDVRVEVTPK